MNEEYHEDDYEGEFDLEEAGYLEDAEDVDAFEKEYEAIFADGDVDTDTADYDHDSVTGRRSKRPKMSVLNKSDLSGDELDELFLND